jgi:hypothetical protein
LTAINAIIAEQWQTVGQSSFCGRRPWIMRIRMFACITLLGALLPTAGYPANPVSDKASNIAPADTRATIAPELPPPPVPDNASPLAFLHAARAALAHGKTGQAQEALERAEARALDRAVPLFQTDKSIDDPLVTQIRQARLALASNDIEHSIQFIASATDTATHLASTQ